MTRLRTQKVDAIAKSLPPTEINGDDSGQLLVLGWGALMELLHLRLIASSRKVFRLAVLYCAISIRCHLILAIFSIVLKRS